ncbi:DUF6233 domain-containing protein [Streptomyces iconiensis]|uniref:DUF6233 domain-containing protein n=1 Tax=Streptomyces iconiensis TaxID=1384038 RepID=A0ABT7A855_9ACTN|nr:DUF6233 domain-containing protein [Streptomyces iconiensis]MDJ1137199.1 DUF6233 domain-containing protein [Streptomyces iconiensis]
MNGWRELAGPWARATLPDGQELDVIVTSRTRTRDGRWWYDCEAILPSRTEHADGRTEAKGAPTPICVAADHITPVPGEDYSAVPTDGITAGRPWLAVRVHGPRDEHPWWCLHRPDCGQATEYRQHRRLTTQEAATLLATAEEAHACTVCRPDRALRAH